MSALNAASRSAGTWQQKYRPISKFCWHGHASFHVRASGIRLYDHKARSRSAGKVGLQAVVLLAALASSAFKPMGFHAPPMSSGPAFTRTLVHRRCCLLHETCRGIGELGDAVELTIEGRAAT